MGGWVKWEKDIETDPRFLRIVRKLKDVTHPSRTRHARALPESTIVTMTMGALLKFWSYADTHIRSDDTLDLGPADIDELVGVRGFASSLPEDWMRPIDDAHVELPGYQQHNGVEAKKRDLAQKRQERKRSRENHVDVTPARDASVTSITHQRDQTRPDQTRPEDSGDLLSQVSRPPKRTREKPEFEKPEFHEQVIAAYHEALPSLPAVKVWSKQRAGLLNARIRERLGKGKPADTVDYWRALFESVAASDFLCGRSSEWRADLEWLLCPENFAKVIESRYANHRPAA